MSKEFESIKRGLEQAIDYAKGKPVKAIIHEFGPLDVKEIRAQVDMSQSEFASTLSISVATLRHWERGDRKPHGPALALLNAVKRKPKTVISALTEAA